MTPNQRCCFVLWGDQCDEVAAALFVTVLRAAGLRVWVVGISGKRIGGAHGLRLMADLALDEALQHTASVICVVIPCTATLLTYFLRDPRVRNLLDKLQQQRTPLFMATGNDRIGDTTGRMTPRLDSIIVAELLTLYPSGKSLLPFVEELAARLA